MSGGGGTRGAQRIPHLLERIESKGIDTKGLSARSRARVEFSIPQGGTALGYEATILPEICEAVLAARDADVLDKQQAHIAKQCEILIRGLARVGIIALVDETTGYQELRSHNALAEILEAFVAKELRRWVKTFPVEFYKELYRLWGWNYPDEGSSKRTPMVGQLTNDLVYDRLAPGVKNELVRLTKRNEKGRLKTHLHRRLTADVGHPSLREHLAAVVVMMQMSKDKDEFMDAINRLKPKFGETMQLPMRVRT